MIQQRIYTAPKTDAIPPLGVTDKPSVGGALYFNGMKLIPLTQGYSAMVDDGDYDELIKYKWYVIIRNHTMYVGRTYGNRKSQKSIRMHRQIMKLTDNILTVDHIDHNGLNNQRSNLRICTISQNNMNRISRIGASSQFVGVHKNNELKGITRWVSRIQINRKTISLGCFLTEYEAALARDRFIIDNKLEFYRLNILFTELENLLKPLTP